MVPLKIRKFGNSLGVVLPKEVIQRLRTRDGECVFLIDADGIYPQESWYIVSVERLV